MNMRDKLLQESLLKNEDIDSISQSDVVFNFNRLTGVYMPFSDCLVLYLDDKEIKLPGTSLADLRSVLNILCTNY